MFVPHTELQNSCYFESDSYSLISVILPNIWDTTGSPYVTMCCLIVPIFVWHCIPDHHITHVTELIVLIVDEYWLYMNIMYHLSLFLSLSLALSSACTWWMISPSTQLGVQGCHTYYMDMMLCQKLITNIFSLLSIHSLRILKDLQINMI